MDGPAAVNGRGRGGRGRGGGATHLNADHSRGRTLTSTGPPRGLFGGLQKAIARSLASGDAIVQSPRGGVVVSGVLKEAARKGKASVHNAALDPIRVRGLKESKASSNPDGGVKDLLAFLERKASASDSSARDAVRIRKVRQEVNCRARLVTRAYLANIGPVRSAVVSSQSPATTISG